MCARACLCMCVGLHLCVCVLVYIYMCVCVHVCFASLQGIPAFYSLLKAGHLDTELAARLDEHVGKMEEFLGKAGTPYFSGSKPGFSDYMIWPWFERIPMLGQITGKCMCVHDFVCVCVCLCVWRVCRGAGGRCMCTHVCVCACVYAQFLFCFVLVFIWTIPKYPTSHFSLFNCCLSVVL